MASNKIVKLQDVVKEDFVPCTRVKVHSRCTTIWKTRNCEDMFFALLTDGSVYRKLVAFGNACSNLQQLEEGKHYEITNLKAKPPRDEKYMRAPIEFDAKFTS